MAYNELYSLGGGVITDDATATASQILSGYTAYVKGKKITGNITSESKISNIISHIHVNESTNSDYPNLGLYLRFKRGLYYNSNTSGYPEIFFPYSNPGLFPSAITSFCIYSGGATNDWKYADMQYAWGSAVNIIRDGKWIINIPGTYTIIINAISTWTDSSNIYFGYKFLVNGNIVMHDENYVLIQTMGNHILTGSMNCNSGDTITFQYISRNVNGFFQVFLIKTK